jgi:alpha-glucosidase
MKTLFAAILLALAVPQLAAAADWQLHSPSGRVEFDVRTTATGGLQYRVMTAGRAAVNWSALGIVTAMFRADMFQQSDESVPTDLSQNLSFAKVETSAGSDDYTLVTGKRLKNSAAWRQLSLTFHNAHGDLLRLDGRAYEDGAAFRYVLPEASNLYQWVTQENTTFAIGTGGRHWSQPYDFVTKYHPSYETAFVVNPTGTATDSKLGTGWSFPSLFQHDGLWVLLSESGLDASYQGSHLSPDAPNGVYTIAPPLKGESFGFGANYPASTLSWTMPWRVIIASGRLADIAESNLTFSLAPPAKFADTSWIEPGVAAWSWWSDHDSSRDLAKLESFIDLAAEMGWPYSLIDANWNTISDHAMQDLVAYAKVKKVGLIFWYNSGGRHNMVTEQPRNIMDDPVRRRAEFAKLSALGVKGVKVDFFQSDKQDIIRLYTAIMDDAAEFHLMVDFHGSTIPRGWQRTWPNLISMEAVQGAEFYTFPSDYDYAHIAPWQNTVLPFTRNVIGSMDDTPVSFSRQWVKRVTTNAHEAALAVIFESGVQHMADGVAAFRALPTDWKAYFSKLPTAWDETRLLSGAPGEDVVLARRSGTNWYVAGINGEDKAKTVTPDLSHLAGIGHTATLLYDDGKGGFASRRWSQSEGTTLPLAPYGGFVMIFDRP